MKTFLKVISLAIIILLGYVALKPSDDNWKPGPITAYIEAKQFITRSLQPTPAEFPAYTAADIDSVAPGRFEVKGYVDTRNGFNAPIRKSYTVTVGWDSLMNPIVLGGLD